MVMIKYGEFLKMNEEQSDGVETETDLCQIQHLQMVTAWSWSVSVFMAGLFSCLIDTSQIPG